MRRPTTLHPFFRTIRDGFQTPFKRSLVAPQIKLMVASYLAGTTIDDLSRQFYLHRTTVIHHLGVSGVRRRKSVRKMTDRLLDEAIDHYEEGIVLAQVAQEFKFHPRTLHREFVKAVVKIRIRW